MADSLIQDLRSTSQYIKWLDQGQAITGTIVNIERRQETVFGSGEPAEWPNGDPKMQAVFTLATQERNPEVEDDNGERRVTVNLYTGQRRSLIAACKDAGIEQPEVGMRMSAKWEDGNGTAQAPRVFRYTFKPGSGPLAGIAASEPKTTGTATDNDAIAKARKLIAGGLSAAEVADLTGLPVTEVAELG